MLIIKKLRRDKKETQTELGNQIGVSLRTIQNWEAGITDVPFIKLRLIARYFDVSVSYLFGEHIVITEDKRVKSGFEIEIEKIFDAKFEVNQANIDDKFADNQKEIEDINTKLNVISEAVSKIILEIEENKALKDGKRSFF